MEILIFGAAAILVLFFVFSRMGRPSLATQKQYGIFAKRFRLELKEVPAGYSGLGARETLHGEFRGYATSLYGHYQGKRREKVEWTTLTMEALFADDLEWIIYPKNGDNRARFELPETYHSIDLSFVPDVEAFANDLDFFGVFLEPAATEKLIKLSRNPACGALRLSKGFLEYRETGQLKSEERRMRFQEALLLLADLADAISIYKGTGKRKSDGF